MDYKTLVAIDPGNDMSGIVVLQDGHIVEAVNLWNAFVWDRVTKYSDTGKVIVVIEDIRPYSGKLTMQVIGTCKFIGELNYRAINAFNVKIEYLTRYDVKSWIINTFNSLVFPLLEKRIADKDRRLQVKGKKGLRNKDGSLRKPSFRDVNDRIVQAAMVFRYNFTDTGPGKRNKCGLSKHSWQALAVGCCFLDKQ
jgi:hypothetical protein